MSAHTPQPRVVCLHPRIRWTWHGSVPRRADLPFLPLRRGYCTSCGALVEQQGNSDVREVA